MTQEMVKQSVKELKKRPEKQSMTIETKEALGTMLEQCYDILNIYGKQPEQLTNINLAFQMVLAPYKEIDIRKAFHIWLKRYDRMPTPSDIVRLIERKGKPPLDKAIYIKLCKMKESGGAFALNNQELEYMKDYEENAYRDEW